MQDRIPTATEMPGHAVVVEKETDSFEWRRFGRERRMHLLYSSDDCGSAIQFHFKISELTEKKCPIEKYYGLGEELLIAFQEMQEASTPTSLDEAYTLGHLLMKFLSTTVCAHAQYTSSLPAHIKLRQRSLKIRELVRCGLHQISKLIDDEEFDKAKISTIDKASKQEDDVPTVSITLSDDAEIAPNESFTSTSCRNSKIEKREEGPLSFINQLATHADKCPVSPMQEKSSEIKSSENTTQHSVKQTPSISAENQTLELGTGLSSNVNGPHGGGRKTQEKPSSRFKELIAQWQQGGPQRLQVEDMARSIPNYRLAPEAIRLGGVAFDDISDVSNEGSSYYIDLDLGGGKENQKPVELGSSCDRCTGRINRDVKKEPLSGQELSNGMQLQASSVRQSEAASKLYTREGSLVRRLEMIEKRLAESEAKRKELQSEVLFLQDKLCGRPRMDHRGFVTSNWPSCEPPREIIVMSNANCNYPSTDIGEI